MEDKKEQVLKHIYDFFVTSADFNGIPLRQIGRELNIPYKKSIDIINACNVHEFDYCTVNDHPYFCTCGMGFDAFISQKFAEGNQRGPLKYVENVLVEGLRYHSEIYTIEDEMGTHRYSAYLVSCANASQYGNNAYIAPQASMSDGLLDVIVIEPFSILDAAHVGFDLMNKTLNKSNLVKTFKTKKVLIHRQKEGPIHFDGEPMMMDKELEIRVVEKGIKMICNAEAENPQQYSPNAIQNAMCELFNDIADVNASLTHQGRNLLAMNKRLWRKLTK